MSMTQSQADELGDLISRARLKAGLSIRQLARNVGAHHSWIGYLEQGRYLDPAPQHLAKIAQVLSIPVDRIERLTAGALQAGLPEPRVYFRAKMSMTPEETERIMRYIDRMRRAA
jgi:transcriptional regulator with XRE-family HTH domain